MSLKWTDGPASVAASSVCGHAAFTPASSGVGALGRSCCRSVCGVWRGKNGSADGVPAGDVLMCSRVTLDCGY